MTIKELQPIHQDIEILINQSNLDAYLKFELDILRGSYIDVMTKYYKYQDEVIKEFGENGAISSKLEDGTDNPKFLECSEKLKPYLDKTIDIQNKDTVTLKPIDLKGVKVGDMTYLPKELGRWLGWYKNSDSE